MNARGTPSLTALLAIATLAVATVASAETPTVSDFAFCNAQATDAVANDSPSTLPRIGRAPGASGGDQARGPDAPVRPAPEARAPGEQAPPTDSTGKIVKDAADPQHEGMDATRAGEPAYRAAYKSCMRQRGF